MSKNYDVGYKKPPKNGQFKKGRSGNRKGRPKGVKNMKTILHDIWESKVAVVENGKSRNVPFVEVFMRKMVSKGLNGTMRDQISLLKAFNDFVPEVLQEVHVPEQLRVTFVNAKDGKPFYIEEDGSRTPVSPEDDDDDSWLD
ncbi:hypothetical protein JYU02_00870 [bacterium AH-315-P15]|nr:hypothetical protein [bacterium AH-315-P15]